MAAWTRSGRVGTYSCVVNNRPWLSPAAAAFANEHLARYTSAAVAELDTELHALVAEQERHANADCITLYAGTNVPNPRSARLLGSSIGSRPNLGHPGDTYNRGMDAMARISTLVDTSLARLFGAAFVETRVASGSVANLYTYLATTKPGDAILAFSDEAAGHVTHHSSGAAGLVGLQVHDVPFDAHAMDVNVAELERVAVRLRPKLIIVAGSMCLFPYNVREVRRVADIVGAYVLYDAAHMGGMIAGGAFQQPLPEGAHVMTGSTYKSFGGPPSGMILTNDAGLAERFDRIAYPGLTANFDAAKTAALGLAVLDLLEFGPGYAAQCLANAQALASAMDAVGLPVFRVPRKGFTASQHVALSAVSLGGGNAAAKLLEPANVLTSSIGLPAELVGSITGDANGIRLGTQEITRWGMTEEHMAQIAEFLARVLTRGESAATVRRDVVEFRRNFQTVHFVRP
jgi:glycine hydroxymethyltransferase